MEAETQFPAVAVPSHDDGFQILHRKTKRQEPVQRQQPEEDFLRSKTAQRKPKPRQGSYEAIGLSQPICNALAQAGYNFPTPIQRKVIPPILDGHDVVAMARTGSGKTAAFLAPLLHRLDENPLLVSTSSKRNGPRALVIAPTRELVLQELRFCRMYSKHLNTLRTAVVVGGTPLDAQFAALAICPDIVFATPGRLLQLLAEMGARGGLTISTAEIVVFDEADRLFEGTLAIETAALISQLKDKTTESMSTRQTVLVSATMPHALAEFSKTGLRSNIKVIRLDADRSLSPTLATAFVATRADLEKDAALQVILRKARQDGLCGIVFAATHRRVEYLTSLLRFCLCDEILCIHGNMDQVARQDSVKEFRKRKGILIVTDVAARGIDLPELDVVINYDMPSTPKLYIHRIGRAGRAGRFGSAISLVAADELPYMLDVFLFVGRQLKYADAKDCFECGSNPSHAFMMESGFVYGSIPKGVVDEEVELTRNALRDVDIEKAHISAQNAHKLYTKTRGNASGESIRRGKALNIEGGGRKYLPSHPWYSFLESAEERSAAEQAELISVWRPTETTVSPPSRLLMKKKRHKEAKEHDLMFTDDLDSSGRHGGRESDVDGPLDFKSEALTSEPRSTRIRRSTPRQRAMEEQRRQFFLPTQQTHRMQQVRALKARTGGNMGDDLRAYKELQEAAMDMNADENADLLRSIHTGSNSGKYWDRVSKRFVKGGVTKSTSKRNLHVATREARAKTNTGASYGTEDGDRFKRWLLKNKKTVEQFSEQLNSHTDTSRISINYGLGTNDFRKGAFGRKARLAAFAKQKQDNGDKNVGSELKNKDQIKKTRKERAKAEARNVANANKKNGKASRKKRAHLPGSSRGISKTRVITRYKK
ncbi:unnamed protein product [Agarophyton chilense]|eukprot:gb/GEZJ01002183.1/.p1 GENE.gb/GEZJ01002183.1/~~gb/GEZJ01002183.1/.p1  ORF type:complete len:881 (-),score=122.93 gb/GEZJ01002183.1/:820-3462(-)